MKIKLWFKYFFKDNARFWICARFFFYKALLYCLSTSAGKVVLRVMPKKVFDWFVMVQIKSIRETISFKIDNGDIR